MFVDARAGVPQIVGSDDGGVAAGVAKADRAPFQHRDIADPMLFREGIGGREAMPAATDNDDIVGRLGGGLPPHRRPAAVPAQRVPRERKDRVSLHRKTLMGAGSLAKKILSSPSFLDADFPPFQTPEHYG